MRRTLTYSPSLTIPLTHDCPWRCRYCGYRSDHDGLIPEVEFERLLDLAVRQGATEILFLSGEIPDSLPWIHEEVRTRGFPNFIEFARHACERALDRGLLPHSNLGALSARQLERLAGVNASLGLMLENVDDAFNRRVAPEKTTAGRLRTLEAAGRARIPFTSGILIGLGESHASRLRSLDALAESHARHGHLQEIILQNYVPNAGSTLPQAPPPRLDDYRDLIAHWRRIAPDVPIQIPPNINPFWRELLPVTDDLGGISSDGDLVNPRNPWEPPAAYVETCRDQGLALRHRWPVYDRFLERGWIHERVLAVLRERAARNPDLRTVPEPIRETGVRRRPCELLSKPLQGGSLSVGEALQLATRDGAGPEELAAAAAALNQRLHGDRVSYVVNRNANFTNVCITHCSFCGFYRPPGHPEAYTRSLEAVVERIAATPWVTEVCLQGGIHPDLGFDYYRDLLTAIKRAFPWMHLHAYSPMEIHSLRRKTGWSLERIFGKLIEAGLGSVPGTAAEILDDSLRDQLSPDKLRTADWVEIITAAHRCGLRSTATVMFGHRESWSDLVRHLDLLRHLQRQTGGFTEFVPLAFVPQRNRLGVELAREQGGDRGSVAASGRARLSVLYPLARLFFREEIPNLQTSWVKLGPEVAAMMLHRGCNDFGGTLYEESITRESGGPHGECLTPEQIESAIRGARRSPWQRTTLYGQATPRLAAGHPVPDPHARMCGSAR
ncbi:MAG: 5-amino-6-(D-ribitylamino)uracil--L-tyrosine 4-hydroxyphenyl transferase CofH [Verrucomicrobiae bacterium]|nr:5-amino-6-(D-ribitylamino)uracil--L-tyrosine 4-hydroxyphenyl transferase CofH [Verrucomicrobiae bacterium]